MYILYILNTCAEYSIYVQLYYHISRAGDNSISILYVDNIIQINEHVYMYMSDDHVHVHVVAREKLIPIWGLQLSRFKLTRHVDVRKILLIILMMMLT
jgi:hypothetical protein